MSSRPPSLRRPAARPTAARRRPLPGAKFRRRFSSMLCWHVAWRLSFDSSIGFSGLPCVSASLREFPPHEIQRVFLAVERAFQLRILDRREDCAELRAGLIAQVDQVLARQQRFWPDLLLGSLLQAFANEVIQRKIAVTAEAVNAVQR